MIMDEQDIRRAAHKGWMRDYYTDEKDHRVFLNGAVFGARLAAGPTCVGAGIIVGVLLGFMVAYEWLAALPFDGVLVTLVTYGVTRWGMGPIARWVGKTMVWARS